MVENLKTVAMYLGNIITNRRIRVEPFVRKYSFGEEYDKTLPTLLIGWEEVKRNFSQKYPLCILDKDLDNGLFWTFDRMERGIDYERDMYAFYSRILSDAEKRIKYRFFNVVTEGYSHVKRLIQFIKGDTRKHIYVDNNRFVFIYYEGKVLGVSLDGIRYLGIGAEKCIKMLKDNESNTVFDDDRFLSFSTRQMISDNRYIIPYLHSLINR